MVIFPGEPALVSTRMCQLWALLQLRTTEVLVTAGAIICSKLQSNDDNDQANTRGRIQGRVKLLSASVKRCSA